MKKLEFQFVGGRFNGAHTQTEVFNTPIGDSIVGYTENLTDARARGACVHRAELDDQPIIKGYLGPMFNGFKEDSEGNTLICLRYETQEVYDMLSR